VIRNISFRWITESIHNDLIIIQLLYIRTTAAPVQIDRIRRAIVPGYDKVRVCGGAFVTGHVDGNDLVIETLDPSNVPTVEWLLEHPQYYFHAVNTNVGGVSKFPQGDGEAVLIPLFSRFEVRLPLEQVVKWESNELPNPYKIGD